MIRSVLLPLGRALTERNFHTTGIYGLREIVTTKNGKVITVEGRIIPSPREGHLVKRDPKIENNSCILCQLSFDIKHTDVLILKQFVTKRGTMIDRKQTGLCVAQYRRISQLVAMAQEAETWEGKTDVSNREGFKKFNTYYDEKTISTYCKNKWMNKLYIKPKLLCKSGHDNKLKKD
ncbi:UNVERIFIED_CONTAM: hypothetical protein PYX00_007296 [Menopon gallinae]|uniref:28S ribosomal protein S18a, mitochondrial n=1 Tax=Menopon gallinae TaxID=328185 RepID=A0AAW2HI75_9NEOP